MEDEAYSLMGIFGIHIHPAYGEKRYAFIRFQEELLKRNPDQSLFAWGALMPNVHVSPAPWSIPDRVLSSTSSTTFSSLSSQPNLLAWSPKDFKSSSGVVALSTEEFADELPPLARPYVKNQVFTPTAYGIRAEFLLLCGFVDSEASGFFVFPYIALLACKDGDSGGLLALLLHPPSEHANTLWAGSTSGPGATAVEALNGLPDERAGPLVVDWTASIASSLTIRMVSISRDTVRRCVFTPSKVYVTYPRFLLDDFQRRDYSTLRLLSEAPGGFEVTVPRWSLNLLEQQGHNVVVGSAMLEGEPGFSTSIQISKGRKHVVVLVTRCMACDQASRSGMLRVDVHSRHIGHQWGVNLAHSGRLLEHRVGINDGHGDQAHITSWTFRGHQEKPPFIMWHKLVFPDTNRHYSWWNPTYLNSTAPVALFNTL